MREAGVAAGGRRNRRRAGRRAAGAGKLVLVAVVEPANAADLSEDVHAQRPSRWARLFSRSKREPSQSEKRHEKDEEGEDEELCKDEEPSERVVEFKLDLIAELEEASWTSSEELRRRLDELVDAFVVDADDVCLMSLAANDDERGQDENEAEDGRASLISQFHQTSRLTTNALAKAFKQAQLEGKEQRLEIRAQLLFADQNEPPLELLAQKETATGGSSYSGCSEVSSGGQQGSVCVQCDSIEQVSCAFRQVRAGLREPEAAGAKLLMVSLQLRRLIRGGLFRARMNLLVVEPHACQLTPTLEAIFAGNAMAYLRAKPAQSAHWLLYRQLSSASMRTLLLVQVHRPEAAREAKSRARLMAGNLLALQLARSLQRASLARLRRRRRQLSRQQLIGSSLSLGRTSASQNWPEVGAERARAVWPTSCYSAQSGQELTESSSLSTSSGGPNQSLIRPRHPKYNRLLERICPQSGCTTVASDDSDSLASALLNSCSSPNCRQSRPAGRRAESEWEMSWLPSQTNRASCSPFRQEAARSKQTQGSSRVASVIQIDCPPSCQPPKQLKLEKFLTQLTSIMVSSPGSLLSAHQSRPDEEDEDCKSHSSILEHLSSLALESNTKLNNRLQELSLEPHLESSLQPAAGHLQRLLNQSNQLRRAAQLSPCHDQQDSTTQESSFRDQTQRKLSGSPECWLPMARLARPLTPTIP